MHCSGKRVLAVFFFFCPGYSPTYPVVFCICLGTGRGFNIIFSFPLLVSVVLRRANICAVFLGLFVRACVKRRSLLVFSYCIVGCSFGSILEIVETFTISYSFFTWNPPPLRSPICSYVMHHSSHPCICFYLICLYRTVLARFALNRVDKPDQTKQKAGKLVFKSALGYIFPLFLPLPLPFMCHDCKKWSQKPSACFLICEVLTHLYRASKTVKLSSTGTHSTKRCHPGFTPPSFLIPGGRDGVCAWWLLQCSWLFIRSLTHSLTHIYHDRLGRNEGKTSVGRWFMSPSPKPLPKLPTIRQVCLSLILLYSPAAHFLIC